MYTQQKISNKKRLEIIKLYKLGETKRELGRKFEVHWTTIGYIVSPEIKKRKELRKSVWIKNNKEKRNKYYLNWLKSELGQKYIERNKIKLSARYQVQKATRTGELIKESCKVCGSEKSDAHHEDYSKPLEVVWLCRNHHRERHKELGNAHFR